MSHLKSFDAFLDSIQFGPETFGQEQARVRKQVMREIVGRLLEEHRVPNPETFLQQMEQDMELRDFEFDNRR
jgi:hypothetical protein